MPKLLELNSPVGPVLFQVPAQPGEVAAIGRTGEIVEKIAASMGEVLGIVSGVAEGFSAALAGSPVESAELEFGLQFTAKGKLYIVETEAQGSIRVQLTVKPRERPPS
jgi:Trypsin-co-occurring domain 1